MQYKKIKSRRVRYLNIQMSLFIEQVLFFGHKTNRVKKVKKK